MNMTIGRERQYPEFLIGQLKEYLEYDPLTGVFIWKRKVHSNIMIGAIAGTFDKDGYIQIVFSRYMFKAHRLAWFFIHNEWPEQQLDHRDENKSNNSISNLRLATGTQNNANRGPYSNNQLGVKGIRKYRQKYIAQITVSGQCLYLGLYNTVEEASDAYAKAAKHHFGEFAKS